MKTIAVTGGAGFIGATVVRDLLNKGYTVSVIDNLSRGKKEYLEGLDVRLQQVDICVKDDIVAAMQGIDAVIHLAAYGSVVESVEDPTMNFEINARGTLNVLQACVQNDVKKLVFSSTGGALMGNTPPPVNELSLPKPISPYGASKLACEGYINAFSTSYGLNSAICRFANVYGPWSGHKLGVLTKYIKALDAGENLLIYGDGKAERDFIHVSDLSHGIISALETNTLATDVFHLANAKGVTIRELAEALIAISGKENVKIDYLDKRVGEVEKNFADNSKAKRVLGFEPTYDLNDGLQEMWDWFMDNRDYWFD
ncbi:MAG: NAD-dependent epimerase/dehydratase family protein [Arenicella sp.]